MSSSWISRSLLAFGSILLAHACYSAHEHSSLIALSTKPLTSTTLSSDPISSFRALLPLPISATNATTLPLDITLETLVSVVLICIALVGSAEPLRPIKWRVWAAEVDHGVSAKEGGNREEGFGMLEQGRRRGFLDIRRERKEFADWVRGKDDTVIKS